MKQLSLISRHKQTAAHYCLEGSRKRYHCDSIYNLEQQERHHSLEKPPRAWKCEKYAPSDENNKNESKEKIHHFLKIRLIKMLILGAFLGVQWYRIRLPIQETRVSPWSGKIPHVMEQLSLWATTTEPGLQSLGAPTAEPTYPRARALKQEKPPQWEAHAPQLGSSPCSPQLENNFEQQWRPSRAKNK